MNGINILIPVADENRNAQLHLALVSSEISTPFPLAATQGNMAFVINRLLGQPYGWGC